MTRPTRKRTPRVTAKQQSQNTLNLPTDLLNVNDSYESASNAGMNTLHDTSTENRNTHPLMSDISTSENSGPKRRTKNTKADKLGESYEGLLTGLAGILYPFSHADALVLCNHAGPMGKAIANVARENEQFYEVMNNLINGSAYAALFIESASLVIALARNHGFDPLGPVMKNFGQKPQEQEV